MLLLESRVLGRQEELLGWGGGAREGSGWMSLTFRPGIESIAVHHLGCLCELPGILEGIFALRS